MAESTLYQDSSRLNFKNWGELKVDNFYENVNSRTLELDFEFSGQNMTELCENFNRTEYIDNQNKILEENGVGIPEAQIQDVTTDQTSTLATTTEASTTELDQTKLTFDESRILIYYCEVEGIFFIEKIYKARLDY